MHTRNLAALEASVPAWFAGVPVRVHGEHGRDMGDLDRTSRKYQRIRRLYRPFVTHYVALSKDLEHYLGRDVGVEPARIAQIYNGVDTARFSPAAKGRARSMAVRSTDEDLWLVGTVGRLQQVKDQVTLAEAFVRAVQGRRRPGANATGDDRRWAACATRVEKVLDQAGMRELAWLPGARDDVPEILRGLDCFVLPSLAEGISNTILEAMASGLPVVATRVGGNPELIEDGMTGRLVPQANAEAMAGALFHYYDDPALARRHGRAGRQRSCSVSASTVWSPTTYRFMMASSPVGRTARNTPVSTAEAVTRSRRRRNDPCAA